MTDSPVIGKLRSLRDREVRYVALEAARQQNKALADGDRVKAEAFGSVAQNASAVLTERIELAVISDLLASLKRLHQLADSIDGGSYLT